MLTVLKKELKLRLGNAWVLASAVLLTVLSGASVSLFNLTLASSDISYALRLMALPAACILPIPVLISARKNEVSGFDAWIRSFPVSPLAVSAARLLASTVLLLIPTSVFAAVPPLLSAYGNVELAAAYTALLGYLLFLLFWTVFSHFISASCRAGFLRPLLSVGIPLLMFFVDLFAQRVSLPDALYECLIFINPFSLFGTFTYGQFPLTSLLTLLSFSFLFFVLWMRSHEQAFSALCAERPRRLAGLSLALAALLSIGSVAGAFLLPSTLSSFDVRDTATFAISGKTKDTLRALDQNVTVYYLCEGGAKSTDPDIYAFLRDYAEQSPRLQLQVIDTQKDPRFASRYTDTALSDHSLIAVCGERSYVIDNSLLYHYYNEQASQAFTPAYYAYCLEAFEYYLSTNQIGSYDEASITYGSSLYYYPAQTVAYFDGDTYLVNAIHYVTSPDLPTLYLFNGEKNTVDATLTSFLISSGYQIKHLASLKQIPSDCSLLFLYAPTKDLSNEESAELDRYANGGGDIFLCTSCADTDLPNLFAILASYGLSPLESANMVCEQNTQNTSEYSYNFYASVASHAATGNFDSLYALIMPHAISVTEAEGASPVSWIYTTQNACLQLPDGTKQTDSPERYTCGAVSERGNSRLVWISSALSLALQGYTVTSGSNYRLAAEAMDWACQTRYTPISVSSTVIPTQSLSLTSGQASLFSLLLSFILPLAISLVFGVRIYLRKKR